MSISPAVRNRLRIALAITLLSFKPAARTPTGFVSELRAQWPLVVAVGLVPRAEVLSVVRKAGPTVYHDYLTYEHCKDRHSAAQLSSIFMDVRHSVIVEQIMSYRDMEIIVLHLLQISDMVRVDTWTEVRVHSLPKLYPARSGHLSSDSSSHFFGQVAQFARSVLHDALQYPQIGHFLTSILLYLEHPNPSAHLFEQVCVEIMEQLLDMAFELLDLLDRLDAVDAHANTSEAHDLRNAMINLMQVLDELHPLFASLPLYRAFRNEIVRLLAQPRVMGLVGDEVAQAIIETLYDSTDLLSVM
ncbi:BZ3500_MvSof-1268-A1-R1_Chr4-2g07117 [Microbotryum saponariae]|uniref:BZ3500_MvSof-1268-A1-R1_Chr4-2g07117 protein n=1 Tax=Microbotryum saponariae TaxID=289078 RepID=A0A2X0NGD6_9BASI|nr:BZ3500_MvSof-1268-A1-R1_Chr4-2g07117 [Microbotryum saponariae]SDA06782.1 BZ3501_MvSof-1269-A2-R1_Chr4-2g06828 [Microbotryum saponariae]